MTGAATRKNLQPFARLTLAVLLVLPALALAADRDIALELNKGKLVRLDRAASSVIIADPTIADVQVVSPGLIYINGKKTGDTSVFAIDAQDEEILNATVTVTHNLSKLNRAVKKFIPDADINFTTVDGALVANGSAASPIEAADIARIASPFLKEQETLVNMIQTAGADQVALKVKVAEVSRSELKRFGINWESILGSGNFIFGLANGRDFINATGTITRSPQGDNSLNIGFNDGANNINAVIDALESDGLVTILAEPNLTALSGKTARFLAGGEFPIPVLGQDDQVTIEYRPYGVSLAFTPQVLSKRKIGLTVAPEVSTLSQTGAVQTGQFNIPALITRRAETTVELASGQTFAIAGLLQNNSGNDIDKFPGLGDLPIIGALFRSTEFRHDQTELVILVTPYIVNGVAEAKLQAPTDTYIPATDAERIWHSKLYHEHDARPASGDAPLNGQMGYILR